MKNVLIISGSPRKKGNSQRLCEEFKKGAEDKGNPIFFSANRISSTEFPLSSAPFLNSSHNL